jgi:PAS domain S-box-containing protein
MELSLFREFNVLYIEDEESIRTAVCTTFKKIFKNTYSSHDGAEALKLYKKLSQEGVVIDIIVSDIDLPHVNGIEIVKYIKTVNPKIEVIMTTARSDANYLLEAIKIGVAHYALKPLNMHKLLLEMYEILKKYKNEQIIVNQHNEMENYLEILEKVAVVSKSDEAGKITFVNDIFAQVSQFSKKELIGANHNIIRHPETPKALFEEMWKNLQNNKMWQGKIKNKNKSGGFYFVYAYIFPIFNHNDSIKIGYIGIRFIITEYEMARLDFTKKVIQNISKFKQKEQELYQKIEIYEAEKKESKDLEYLTELYVAEKNKNKRLLSQLDLTEEELKELRGKYQEKISDINDLSYRLSTSTSELKKNYENLKKLHEELKDEDAHKGEIIISLEEEIKKQSVTIENLRDVINHQENKLTQGNTI